MGYFYYILETNFKMSNGLKGILCIFMIEIVFVQGLICENGYFDDLGICTPCLDSWLTWVDNVTWKSCLDSMFLNATSNLWELCVDGEYFNPTSQTWLPWSGSCNGRWAYQSFCFDCSVGEFYDLEKMGWVRSWGVGSISISDEQLWSKPVWRSFNYYVDPSSTQIIELGTRAFPFKNIGLPFVEILNYHSHSTNNITVFIKENTKHNMLYNSNYVINITQVTVESYSDSNLLTPYYAKIIMKNSGVVMQSAKTVFNIIKHTTLRLDSIVKTSEILAEENNNSKK